MNQMSTLPTDNVAVVGYLAPISISATTLYTGYVPMKLFQKFLVALQVGVITGSGTLDAKIIAYTDGAGAGAYDVPGAAITQLTGAGSDSGKVALINFDKQLLAGNTAYTHFRVAVTAATAASVAGCVVLGVAPLYGPASANDAAIVDEIVSAV